MANLWLQLHDRVLTTAEILYYFPDYPDLLQQFIWQDYDVAPQFPHLNKFLGFWSRELEGRLHSVRISNVGVLFPGDIRLPALEVRH
ncbi:MAG: Usg protein [Alphaproteobacteria bacterium]|nr:Usg protein [Alphaproteobacteria bacterium]